MQEKKKKEKWGRPKLIILTRGKSEEAVLTACKLQSESGGDYAGSAYGCALWQTVPGACSACVGVIYS